MIVPRRISRISRNGRGALGDGSIFKFAIYIFQFSISSFGRQKLFRMNTQSPRNQILVLLLAAVALLSVCILLDHSSSARAQGPVMSAGAGPPVTTWRPNKKDAKYAGPQSCVKCHTQESATQHATAMGRAAQPVEISDVLRAYPRLTFRGGGYSYEILRRGDQSIYTI